MPVQNHEIDVNGTRYTVRDFTGTESQDVFRMLAGVAGPAFAAALSDRADSPAEKDEADKALSALERVDVGRLIAEISAQLEKPSVSALIRKLLSKTIAHEQREHGTVEISLAIDTGFDDHFSGPLGFAQLIAVLTAVVKMAFGPFLATLGSYVKPESRR